MRALKYLAFLLAVFAFMVFFGHQEKLDPTESIAITEFEARVAQENAQPIAVVSENLKTPGVTQPTNVTVPSTTAAATVTTPPAMTGIPTIANGEILEDSVNIRSGPGLDFPVVTQLYRWDKVILGEQSNGWFELYIDGHKYYVSSDFAVLNPVQ